MDKGQEVEILMVGAQYMQVEDSHSQEEVKVQGRESKALQGMDKPRYMH